MSEETLDIYAPLNHHPHMGSDRHRFTATWIPREDQRRLAAYDILSRYTANRAATLRLDPGAKESLREYGDAELLVTTTRDLVLGEAQTIRCEDSTALAWFEEWAVKERLELKLLTAEQDAVELGDTVLTVGWNPAQARPVLRVHNPGFYFPHITPGEDEFPRIVAIAYEYADATGKKWIRRYRWELVPLESPFTFTYGSTSNVTCFYSAEDISVEGLITGADVHTMIMSKTQNSILEPDENGEIPRFVDMGIDFIPVIHIPNTPSTQEHFGESVLLHASQVFNDLHNTDTDLNLASQQAAPPLVTTDDHGNLQGGPGAVWGGVEAKYVDTSKNLTALQSHLTGLRDRIGETTRVSKVLLGQVAPNEVPSGYALELGFHPSRNLMHSLRAVRDEKYPLILKFAYRLAQTYGLAPAGPTPHAWIELGPALPADKPTAISQVKEMRAANAMSTLTAVRTLQAAGFPVEDAEKEVELIRQEWFAQAYDLVRATGDPTAARRMLGLPDLTARVTDPVEATE